MPIPFHHGELRLVQSPCLALAEHAADRVYVGVATGEQSLHEGLGRRLQKQRRLAGSGDTEAVDIRVARRVATQCRRIDFEHAARAEESTRPLEHGRALPGRRDAG